MREIVHVQIGRSGNLIGTKFWKVILAEHGLTQQGRYKPNISELQKQRIDVYFSEGADERRVPRAILVGFDCRTMHKVLGGYHDSPFNINNVVCSNARTYHNWAKGYYSEGADILEEALKIVRTEVEACDSIQGIQIVHAIGGGGGSGFGSLFAQKMAEEYPNRILKSYTLIPLHDDTLYSYNAVLTIPYLIDCIHQVFCINNEAVARIYSDKFKKVEPSFSDINYLISLCMSGITACLRFPGQLNISLKKLLVNMVPFPQLHFFAPGYVSLSRHQRHITTLVRNMFERNSIFIDCDPRKGRFLTAAGIFRGRISPKEIDENMNYLQQTYSQHYVKWIPHNIKTAICDIATYNTYMSATSLSNTTAIQDVFMKLLDQFQTNFKSKNKLHYYFDEGVQESDFLEAQDKLLSLISEYQQYQDAEATTAFVEESIPYVEN